MPATFNHTIVWSEDKEAAAAWFARVMGLGEPFDFTMFKAVELAGGVTLDFGNLLPGMPDVRWQHYAFLVTESEFDEIFGRIVAEGIEHWADPMLTTPGEINPLYGGRGVYFKALSGHVMEILTAPHDR